VLQQQSPIGRTLRMEGVRRLAVTQMNRSQRRQIICVDEIAGLHPRGGKVIAQHLPKGIGGQPSQECRRYAEAS
jgi:hypothetical protein